MDSEFSLSELEAKTIKDAEDNYTSPWKTIYEKVNTTTVYFV